jgi:hypothetical protein
VLLATLQVAEPAVPCPALQKRHAFLESELNTCTRAQIVVLSGSQDRHVQEAVTTLSKGEQSWMAMLLTRFWHVSAMLHCVALHNCTQTGTITPSLFIAGHTA